MSDTSASDPVVGFDETNGVAGDLDGESDGTAAGENGSAADRNGETGIDVEDQDAYVAETLQEGTTLGDEDNGTGGFHTGD